MNRSRQARDGQNRTVAAAGLRRGLSVGGLAALLAATALLLVVAFVMGRQSARWAEPGELGERGQGMAGPDTVAAGDAGPSRPAPRAAPGSGAGGASTAPAATAPPVGPPPFEFDPPEIDFGFVRPDTELTGSFLVRNVSNRPLRIQAVRADCKCTTVGDLDGTIIAPGEALEVTAVVDGRPSGGAKRSEIRFLFDGYNEVATIGLRSTVGRMVSVDPTYLAATKVTSGEVFVTSVDGRPFRILAVDGKPPRYAGASAAGPEPRTEHRLAWDLGSFDPDRCVDQSGRRMPRWWVIETDHPEAPIVDLRVRHLCTLPARPQGGWFLSQQRAVLDAVTPGEAREFTVFLKWVAGEKPSDTIRDVRSESPQFTASLVGTERNGDRITCRVRVTPRPDHRGLIYGVARFTAFKGHSFPLTVIGRVVEEKEKQASAH